MGGCECLLPAFCHWGVLACGPLYVLDRDASGHHESVGEYCGPLLRGCRDHPLDRSECVLLRDAATPVRVSRRERDLRYRPVTRCHSGWLMPAVVSLKRCRTGRGADGQVGAQRWARKTRGMKIAEDLAETQRHH